jgi:tryptophanyl-tRNA synthetase
MTSPSHQKAPREQETHDVHVGAGRKARVFSGVQPTGDLHIGTYVGALKQWVEKQSERDNIFCVVDLHALTVPEGIDPVRLRNAGRQVAALYFACGIDPDENIVFIQSQLHEHAELTWILNCITPLGWLQRMTQFKSKAERADSIGTGLLDYPVLQAADILLYDTDIVPVGEDQRQHVELTRDIAIRFNNLFGEVFVLPKVVVPEVGARIMGFDEPEVKMSKSIAAERRGHAINLLDDEKTVKKTIMSAVTDSEREVRFEYASPGVRKAEFEGHGYGVVKKTLLAAVLDTLAPIQARHREIMDDPDALDVILHKNAERARETAARTLERVKSAVGLG